MPSFIKIALTVIYFGVCATAQAVEAEFPLSFGHDFIQQSLIQQVFTSEGHSFRPIDDGTGCHSLQLRNPEVTSALPYLKISAVVEAKIGTSFSGQCVSLIDWVGRIEMYESFVVSDRGTNIKVRVKKSKLIDATGSESGISNQLWQLINQHVHPRMEAVVFNIKEPVTEIKNFIPIVFPNVDKKSMIWMINTLWIKKVEIDKSGIQVHLKINIPSRYTKGSVETPVLSDKEKQRVIVLLDQLDVFYSQLIKQLALKKSEENIQDTLFEILLELRHELVELIALDEPLEIDPVPQLFLDTWQRLRPVFKVLSQRQNPFQESFRYLSFIAAVDALPALQKYGPAMGLEISTDGLKRLIRIVLPQLQNPLQIQEGVDQQLRDAFDLGNPPKSKLEVRQLNWLDWLNRMVTPAHAEGLDPVTVKLIDQFIPGPSNLDTYIPLAQKVIKLVSDNFLENNKLSEDYQDVFKWTVVATAWKESCWRQYVSKKGQRKPLMSNAGAVGMMQVVPKIWRGFFEPYQLEWDTVYNLEAGIQILYRYMTRYAIRKGEHKREGGVDNLARATYAAYNAGPGKLTRYRQKKVTRRQKRVDREYYSKFKKVKNGKSGEVELCFG